MLERNPDASPTAASATPVAARPLLADRYFRRAWAAGALAQTMRWLEVLAVSVFVFRLTGDALQVALVLFLRMLPSLLFGAFAGVVAERLDRKSLLVGGFAALSVLWLGLGVLVVAGTIQVWHVALGVFLNGIFWSMDFPVRRTMLGDLAGINRIGMAMGLDSSTSNATRMLGPLLGGLLLEMIGMQGAYFLGAVLFAAGCLLILSVRYRSAMAARGPNVLANIREGLRYVRSSRVIVGTLAVTLLMNLWGFAYMGMVPVIGEEVLGLDPFANGVLMSAEGLGALIGALAIAVRARPAWYTRLYVGGSVLFLTAVLLFSRSESYPLSLALLFFGGFGFAAFATMQSTIVLTSTLPEFRPRVMGVLAMSVGAGAPLGILHVGLLAHWLGAPTAVTVIASEGLAAVIAAFFLWPELWRAPDKAG